MDIRINRLELSDFKGIKNTTIILDGQSASISADNGVGKTSVYDGFIWCLFGKDSKGKSDFEIVPIENGVSNREAQPTVNVQIALEGSTIDFKRVLKPKWINKRGDEEKTFEGYTTDFYINEIPVKQADYKAKIDSIVSEQTFRIITNLDTFLTMHKKDQRSYLLAMVDSIDPVAISKHDPDMLRVVVTMKEKGYTADDLMKLAKTKIAELTKEKDGIVSAIEVLAKTLEQTESSEELQRQLDGLEKEIELSNQSKYGSVDGSYRILSQSLAESKDALSDLKHLYQHGMEQLKTGDITCSLCGQPNPNGKDKLEAQVRAYKEKGIEVRKYHDDLEAQVNQLKATLETMRSPETMAEMVRFRDDIKEKLFNAKNAERTKHTIEEMKQRMRDITSLIANSESIQDAVTKFNRVKAYALQESINALFPTLKFRLFDEALNGNLTEDCTALIRGEVPYSNCSRSEAIRAGQEVINAIQEKSGNRAPCFIDNAESATWFIPMNCQTIKLIVSENKKELEIVKL